MARNDPDAAACYEAEDSVAALTHRSWYRIEQAARWLKRFLASAWAKARFSRKVRQGINLIHKPRMSQWLGEGGRHHIALSTMALARPFVVLHELAHTLAIRACRDWTHGAQWRSILLALVGRYVGRGAACALRRAYHRRGLTTLSGKPGRQPKSSSRHGGKPRHMESKVPLHTPKNFIY